MKLRRLVAGTVALVVVAGVVLLGAGYRGAGPLASWLGVRITHVVPTGVVVQSAPADPLTVHVVLPWPHQGICSGQFRVSATESAGEVRVSDVTSVEYRGGSCAGLGTDGVTASALLSLRAPLGDRAVVRASDGQALPVRTAS